MELVTVKDNTLYQSSSGSLSNGAGIGLFVGKTNGGQIRRALIQFDIANAIPTGSIVQSVELNLTLTRTAAGGEPISVHRVTSEWGEGTSDAGMEEGRGTVATDGDATWTLSISPGQMWTNQGGDFIGDSSAQRNVTSLGRFTWDSTDRLVADVQGWVDNPGSNFGWIMVGDEGNSKSTKRFGSREASAGLSRPMLVVRFTSPA